jgi:NAD(P)-dependent dehydrogenase (short-subunit alcohol dehydrogenase family)
MEGSVFMKSMDNAFSLKGKNTIVTGGAKGIGLGITEAFAHQGANVAIFARDDKAAGEVIKSYSAKYEGKFTFYKTDIADMKSVKDAVARYVADNGRIDVLVNNAGIGTAGRFIDMDEELTDWFDCFNVDLHGAARMSYHVVKHMMASGKGGHIINIT